VFQDDNCRAHRARVVREFLDEQGVRTSTLPWPSKSPDINPKENIWGRMTSIMYKNVFRPNTVEQLQQKIVDTWHEISPEHTNEFWYHQCHADYRWSLIIMVQ
jgi:transposase